MRDELQGIPTLNITELIKRVTSRPLEIYKDELVIIDFSRRDRSFFLPENIPSRVDAFSMLMVISGECTIHINYIPYRLKPNMFVVIRSNQVLSKISISDNFTGYHIIVKNDFMHVALKNSVPPVKEIFERGNLEPVIIAPEKDFGRLIDFINQLIRNINLDEHIYQRELVLNALSNFILEIWNITASVSADDIKTVRPVSLYEEITLQFLSLVSRECKEIRDVSYYSTQLCVTPVYLTRIIKQLTGKTATQCISEILSDEAKLLLHQPGTSIQQIAEELHFSDQAAFSKFFKKNTGMSPVDYRRNLGIR